MIKRFNEIYGYDVEIIAGQHRLGYTLTSNADFYDVADWKKQSYPGNQIYFYDFSHGAVYIPFEKKTNIMYGKPLYAKGRYYFLQADFNVRSIVLYSLDIDDQKLSKIINLKMADLNLYNLQLMGTDVYIISQGDHGQFKCYYPMMLDIALQDNESVVFIDDDKIYLQAWIEEGWDEVNSEPTDNYCYYNRLIIKDFTGQIIKEEPGTLIMDEDGQWWIS